MDLAHLGIRADSKEVVEADKNLQNLSATAGKTDKSIDGLRDKTQKAETASSKMNESVQKQTKSWSALNGVYVKAAAALGGVIGAGAMMTQFIRNTIEADEAQAQLAASLQSTRGASGQTIESLNKHAAALQSMTKFGDDAVNAAQGLLLSFTRVGGDVFPRATSAILDMATAMKMDLQSATLQVGKALNDPILGVTALSRAGVQFSEKQKALIKDMVETNRVAEAQAMILKELEVQFGGSARAARETLGGAITSLSNAWGDLFEVGKNGSEVLRLAIESLITAIQDPAFMSFMQMIGVGLFTAMSLLVNAINLAINGIVLLGDNLDIVIPIMLAAFGPAAYNMVLSFAASFTGVLIPAVKTFFAIIAANPLTIMAAAVGFLILRFTDWEVSIQNIIKAWGLFVAEWNLFWGNEAGARRGLEIYLNAEKAVADLKTSANEIKNNVLTGFKGGTDHAAPRLENAIASGGAKAAQSLQSAQEAAMARYQQLNGVLVKEMGDTLIEGGNYIYNQADGSIRSAGESASQSMGTALESGGSTAGTAIESAMGRGAATVYNTIEAAFATLAPLYDVFNAFNRQLRAEIALMNSEAGLNRAQRERELAEANRLRRNSLNNSGGGSGGSSGGGRSGSVPGFPISTGGFGTGAPGTPTVGSDAAGADVRQPTTSAELAEQARIRAENKKVDIQIVNRLDPQMMADVLGTRYGQEQLMNAIAANRTELAALLGVA